jgi:glucose/arabinose dehydrogenase
VSLDDPNQIDATSRRVLLRIEGFSPDHPLGQIAFDPNLAPSHPDWGLLYAALGDGGGYIASQGDEISQWNTAQDRTNPYGDILRIDPHGIGTPQHPTNGQYGIPSNNPYTGAGAGILEEIWAYGLRNPHRFGWDEGGAGKMLISDIGQAQLEEVNLGAAGANYGWRERQGTYVLDPFNEYALPPLPGDDAQFGYTYPVAQYDHDEGSAIVGAGVYRGSAIPPLVGKYVFGDIVNGRIFYTDAASLVDGTQAPVYELVLVSGGQVVTLLQLVGSTRVDLRFGVDQNGELYALSKRDGGVRTLPETQSDLGLAAGMLALCALRRRAARRSGVV